MKKKVKFSFLGEREGRIFCILQSKYRRGYGGKLIVEVGRSKPERYIVDISQKGKRTVSKKKAA
jgi:hypothetical protein